MTSTVTHSSFEVQAAHGDEPHPIEVPQTRTDASGATSTVTQRMSVGQRASGDGPHPDSTFAALPKVASGSDEATTAYVTDETHGDVGGTTCPDPKVSTTTREEPGSGGSVSPSDQPTSPAGTREPTVDPMAFLELRILAESFADTQANRIACLNRMERGGVPPDLFAAQIEALIGAEHAIELALVRRYRKLVRSSLPGVDAWQRASKGIGEKLLARLLGHLGSPAVAYPYHWGDDTTDAHVCGPSCRAGRHLIADPTYYRTKAQLRSYCGHGDPLRKRHRGMSADEAMALGSPGCKMLVHLLAEACMKQVQRPTTVHAEPIERTSGVPSSVSPTNDPTTTMGTASVLAELPPEPSPFTIAIPSSVRDADPAQADPDDHVRCGGVSYIYRQTYDARRLVTAERVHAVECLRCGPSGKPAQVGSPWSKAHQHADALRIVGKTILNDLWSASQVGAS